jgi:hypothetical protein
MEQEKLLIGPAVTLCWLHKHAVVPKKWKLGLLRLRQRNGWQLWRLQSIPRTGRPWQELLECCTQEVLRWQPAM